ncbi:MAG: hypothetical protein NC319_08445 [Butyricicoccus sp.]|nr:hypothetical protein [Butyricicoccus sp.]
MRENGFRQELLRQARELVFNKGSDAALLAFRGDVGQAGLEGLDLSAVSSIHRMANGSVEMKFIDRIKLIELLLDAGDDRRRAEGGDGFIQALDRAAMRLGGETRQRGADEYAAGELDLARERRAADVGGAARGAEDGGDEPG